MSLFKVEMAPKAFVKRCKSRSSCNSFVRLFSKQKYQKNSALQSWKIKLRTLGFPLSLVGEVMKLLTCRGRPGSCCNCLFADVKKTDRGKNKDESLFHVSTGLGTILLGVSGNWEDKEVTSLPEEFPREPDSENDTSCWKAGWSKSLCRANSLRAFHGGW